LPYTTLFRSANLDVTTRIDGAGVVVPVSVQSVPHRDRVISERGRYVKDGDFMLGRDRDVFHVPIGRGGMEEDPGTRSLFAPQVPQVGDDQKAVAHVPVQDVPPRVVVFNHRGTGGRGTQVIGVEVLTSGGREHQAVAVETVILGVDPVRAGLQDPVSG